MENSNMFNLNWLLWPYDKGDFFKNIWQKKSEVIVTGRENYFADVFSMSEVERIIEFCQPSTPNSIRLACASTNTRTEVPYCPNGRINIDQLRKLYLSGQTVILNSVENFSPMVARLARSIETEMNARVQVNSYLTPPSAQGFRAHYDTHDVLVVQVSGEKLWHVHGGDIACPLNEMVDGEAKVKDSAAPPSEIRMRAGDVMYIPRGWIHEAVTDCHASLHLTFGIHPPLGKDLLNAAIEELVGIYPELREALPVGPLSAPEKSAYLKKRYSMLVELLASHDVSGKAAQAIDDQFLRRGRSGGDGHLFKDAEKLKGLSEKSKLERRTNIPCRVLENDQEVGLQFLNGLIKGPVGFKPAMDFVSTMNQPFFVSDLPGLSTNLQLVLATSLVKDGLCHIQEA